VARIFHAVAKINVEWRWYATRVARNWHNVARKFKRWQLYCIYDI